MMLEFATLALAVIGVIIAVVASVNMRRALRPPKLDSAPPMPEWLAAWADMRAMERDLLDTSPSAWVAQAEREFDRAHAPSENITPTRSSGHRFSAGGWLGRLTDPVVEVVGVHRRSATRAEILYTCTHPGVDRIDVDVWCFGAAWRRLDTIRTVTGLYSLETPAKGSEVDFRLRPVMADGARPEQTRGSVPAVERERHGHP